MAEKNTNEMPPELRKLFTKGSDALSRDNFDYAIDLFTQVLATDPAFFDCRKLLRTAQQRKAGSGGTGFFRKAFSNVGSSPQVMKAQMALRSNPAEAITMAEQALNSDPNNSSAHKIIVEAAMALQMPQTAVMSLEVLAKNSPKDKAVAMQFAQMLADIGEVDRAEKFMMDVVRASPHDPDLSQALKNVSASKSMNQGGYENLKDGKGSYRDILKNESEAKILEQENRVQKSEDVAERLIREYEERLKAEPNNLRLLRQLAELYTQKKQFDRALSYYDRVKASDMGADSSLDQAINNTMVKQFDHNIEQLDKVTADYPELLAKLNAEKIAFQIADCQRRVEKYPTDLGIRFEMGVLYFQADKINEATQEFQKAQGNANKRIAAMNYLAQCFSRKKMYDLAARTFQNAIKEKAVFDDEKKELIYNLGVVLESLGKKEEAIEQFKILYESDIGYRDVAAKVDAYYAAQ